MKQESETTLNLDLLSCPQCARQTPAARGACIYCGAALPLIEITTAPPQRVIDSFERAFNTVLHPFRPRDDRAESALAAALNIELAEARAFISSGKPVPLSRSHNRQEAEMISALVRSCGLACSVVADEDLQIEYEMIRARRIARSAEHLDVHHSGGVLSMPLAELKMLVVGSLRNLRLDYLEGASGLRNQPSTVLDTAEFRSDEMLLDVYTSSIERSFRIKSDAFDYSGLVSPLSFRAEMNFQTAIIALREAAPHAAIDEDFTRMRPLLARAWPERSRTEARGVKRAGLAYRPVSQSSVVKDNRDQFDRYSRLMFIMSA
ncbi:MAG TPA: hypothetical protein VLD57_11870 [Blastocatellia bacterium]|nr:hypothetical protein [Blastocatellia bacterium]